VISNLPFQTGQRLGQTGHGQLNNQTFASGLLQLFLQPGLILSQPLSSSLPLVTLPPCQPLLLPLVTASPRLSLPLLPLSPSVVAVAVAHCHFVTLSPSLPASQPGLLPGGQETVFNPGGIAMAIVRKGCAAGAALYVLLACGGTAGCMGSGRVEQAGAEVLDLVAKQTAGALDEYERDLQAVDAGRRQAVIENLAERAKRDGPQQVDAHAAAALQALEKIAADRQMARQRYEAAMDNVEVLREVAGGFRRYGERVRQLGDGVAGMGKMTR
jgi:hypothetical protein